MGSKSEAGNPRMFGRLLSSGMGIATKFPCKRMSSFAQPKRQEGAFEKYKGEGLDTLKLTQDVLTSASKLPSP